MDSDFGNIVVSIPQPRNKLENGRGENDKVPRGIRKAVEANIRKVRMAEAKRRRSKEKSRKETRREEKKKKQKKEKIVEVKKVAEKWEIWDKEGKAARSEEEAKKLALEKFHQWIKVFGKKQSERMPTWKIWDYAIELKESFVPKKGKVYLLSKKESEEVREFV